MVETATSNILTFQAKAPNKDCNLSRTLTPKEAHTLSTLIRQIAGKLRTEEAEIFEITQRVFGVCDLSHISAHHFETVTKFLEVLVKSSKAAKS